MDRYSYQNYGSNCLQGGLPPCSAACPFNLDIRKVIKNIRSGKFKSAYKSIREKLIFPGIVCRICSKPCQDSCLRGKKGGAIELRMLERACIEYTDKKRPVKLNLPQKEGKVAVIGAGLTGLACAFFLAVRNYKVTVYEKSDRIGGQLWEIIPKEEFLPEIELQTSEAGFDIMLEHDIGSLKGIDADAFLIATGTAGNDFGLKNNYNKMSFGTESPGIFIAGAVIDADSVLGIAQALVAAHSIEGYFQVGNNKGMKNSFIDTESLIQKDMDKFENKSPVLPKNDDIYTKEEAIEEAERCILCDCTECEDCCEFFQYYKKSPKALATEVTMDVGNNALIRQKSTHRVASCNLCGLCGEVCPQGIDIGKVYYDFRHYKFDENAYFKRFNDYFLRDMEHANREGSFIKTAPGCETTSYLFFPGCQIGAGSPYSVIRTYQYLLKIHPDTAIMLQCCGIPADWAGNAKLALEVSAKLKTPWETLGKPVIVLACASCAKQLSEKIPEAETKMIYDIIADNDPSILKGILKGKTVSVFDPCSSRNLPNTQSSIRKIINAMEGNIEELEFSSESAQCCGWGGHTAVANPELTNKIIEARKNASDNPYIVYCSNCRDNFLTKGKKCMHILDMIFDISIEKPVTLQQRRTNRMILKEELCRIVFGKNTENKEMPANKLIISDDVQKQMDEGYILQEDIEFVIENCEADDNKIWDQKRECFTAHMTKGIFTYWVDYIVNKDDKYEILCAYSHRIKIIE